MTNKIAPEALWAQRVDKVLVSIQLEDVSEEKIDVDDTKLVFSAKSHGKDYEVNLEFNESIIPTESKQRKGGREYYFELKKKEPGPFWPRLLKDKLKPKNIKIDFNRWKDEDESDDEEAMGPGGPGGNAFGNMNLEDMMSQMNTGAGGDFDPSEMADSDDSDDDDIPALEETKE